MVKVFEILYKRSSVHEPKKLIAQGDFDMLLTYLRQISGGCEILSIKEIYDYDVVIDLTKEKIPKSVSYYHRKKEKEKANGV